MSAKRAGVVAVVLAVALVLAIALHRLPTSDRRGTPDPGGSASGVRLVLVIVVDQFRADYLPRFQPHFGERGFNLFLRDGANFTDAKYEYAATDTCPGHAVISTGTWPNRNGIVGNSWYTRERDRVTGCARDDEERLLSAAGGGISPRKLLEPAIGDGLKRATGGRGRIIVVSGKDYAAAMLGGSEADAAYWTRDTLFISSTYYVDALPRWVRSFNASGPFSNYFGKRWRRALPPEAYAAVGPDDVPAEEARDGLGRVFPRTLDGGASLIGPPFVRALEHTPFHNEVLVRFVEQAILHERLGRDDAVDLVAVSFSAIDRLGHRYGPDSHEVMDAVVRMDGLLQRLFDFVDREIGLDHTLVLLTSDHGVAPLPENYSALKDRPPGGRVPESTVVNRAALALRSAYGDPGPGGWVAFHEYPYLYLNESVIRETGVAVSDAERVVAEALEEIVGVERAFPRSGLAGVSEADGEEAIPRRFLLSFRADRAGNIVYEVSPFFLVDEDDLGTNHGSGWEYDAHVPMLWMGPGVRPGTYTDSVSPADIAPTLSALLGISVTSNFQGRVLERMMERPRQRTDPE